MAFWRGGGRACAPPPLRGLGPGGGGPSPIPDQRPCEAGRRSPKVREGRHEWVRGAVARATYAAVRRDTTPPGVAMRRRTIANRKVPRRAGPGRRASAALVAGGYAVVGCTWVLLSDAVLRVLVPGRTGELVGSVKGIGFIVVSTVVLWGVLAARDHLLARSERERVAAVEATTSIFASSPLAIVSVDRDGLITAWSPAAERVLGWAADEVVGRPATILRPDDPAWISRGFAEVLAGETLVAVPVRYPHRDGRARDLELFAAPLRDASGAVRGAVVVAEDLTETHEAQADRARLATAIDQAAEAIVVTDARGAIVYVNPAFEQVTGYDRAELIGQNPRVLKSGVQDAAFYERMWATLLAGRTWRGTLVNRRRDGTLFEEEAAISPVRDAAGTTTAFVAVKRDLTVERALEAGLRAEILDRVAVREAIGRIHTGATPEATAAAVAARAGAPGQSTRWCSTAHSAAWVREASPSLPRMLDT